MLISGCFCVGEQETYNWVEFKKCQEILKDQRYSAFEEPVPSDPMFEAKIQTIANQKQGQTNLIDHDNDDEDDEDDDDEWDSVDEDDEEGHDLDPDDFIDKTVQDSDEDGSQGGSDRKKKKTEDNAVPESSESFENLADEKATAASLEREKKREMNRIFRATTALPPPGCSDPKKIVDSDLYNVLSLTDRNAVRPLVVSIPASPIAV